LVIDPDAPLPSIHVMAYGPQEYAERPVKSPSAVREFLGRWPVTWVHVTGLGDADVIRSLGDLFDLHRLSLEDVVNVHQRPKVEHYGGYLYIVARMVSLSQTVETEQLSIFLGENFVLTFEERPGNCFDPVRERIRSGPSRIRASKPDYLAHALLDAIVDAFFPVLEEYGERLEEIEDEIVEQPSGVVVSAVHEVRRELLTLRRASWPMREAINSLLREPTALVQEETRFYLRDCYDHTVQILDLVENYRELAAGLMDVYLSSVSNRLNEIMKVLTIISTIFIPLTFIAGIYGMNFNPSRSPLNMPELNWYWGYPFSLAFMAAVAFGMLGYFLRKGWLGKRRALRRTKKGVEFPSDRGS
jgi:magnesium transporter